VTVQTLKWRLARPRDEFGDVRLTELRTGEIATWEASLPPRFRYSVVRALRQVLDAAVAWEFLARNPAKATGKNPAPPVIERVVLEPADVDRLAAEMRSPPYDVAVTVGAWCYLRPSELLALERGDVGEGVLRVNGTKTRRSVRTVPVPLRARQALEGLPLRLDTRLLFPAPQGGVYSLANWRRREFERPRDAAGLDESVTPYTLRHSGMSWALHAGVPASDVARFGGTSLTMLEKTYAHLLSASTEAARARMDEFANDAAEAAEGGAR
jgi:integrase